MLFRRVLPTKSPLAPQRRTNLCGGIVCYASGLDKPRPTSDAPHREIEKSLTMFWGKRLPAKKVRNPSQAAP
jgi:hypothetical protein